jgi:hypothetical protein
MRDSFSKVRTRRGAALAVLADCGMEVWLVPASPSGAAGAPEEEVNRELTSAMSAAIFESIYS